MNATAKPTPMQHQTVFHSLLRTFCHLLVKKLADEEFEKILRIFNFAKSNLKASEFSFSVTGENLTSAVLRLK